LGVALGHAQPGQQFVQAERLGQVVVGAGVQRGDLGAVGVAHGEDDRRDGRPLAQPLQHIETVHVR